MPPYSPPNTAICTENATEFCAKKLPHVPPKGGLGNENSPIDGAKNRRYHPGQADGPAATAQRTADNGDQKGEVNMTTPNTGELLVQQAQEAERLRLLILADECKTIEEFREKLRERLNK